MKGSGESCRRKAEARKTASGKKTGNRARDEALAAFVDLARIDLLAFLSFVWWMPNELKVGRHTRAICARLTRATNDFLTGKSTHLVISTPYRHGKSDIVSRAFPAFFLGRCAQRQPDVIMSGYGASLLTGMSGKVQSIVSSPLYKMLFPSVRIDPRASAKEEWKVDGSQGTVVATGLGGAITGKGGHLITLDDYCKNREEAESQTMREKAWASFRDDLMTRQNAPASIVVVIATRWHTDDIIGRIFDAMKKDPDYPRFESMIFPAQSEAYGGDGTLFPEMYDAKWYAQQRAALGSYSAAALLDCNPVTDAARVFRPEWWNVYETVDTSKLTIHIFVDSANSKKAQADYTTMWVVGLAADRNFYVLDGVHDRLNLAERTDRLFELVRKYTVGDRKPVVWWETVGAMSDTAHIRLEMDRRMFRFTVRDLRHVIAKDTRIRNLQPIAEAGRLLFPAKGLVRTRADGTVRDILEELREDEWDCYPAGKHDDMLDALADVAEDAVVSAVSWPQATHGEGRKTGIAAGAHKFDW